MSEKATPTQSELQDNIITPLAQDSLNILDNKDKIIIDKSNFYIIIGLNFIVIQFI